MCEPDSPNSACGACEVDRARAEPLLEDVRRDGVVIAGVSTRAFAESAWRAGFVCETVDAFGDLDQKARVRNFSLRRDLGRHYSAHASAAVSRRLSARAAAYVGNFENHPAAVRLLTADRLLLGNTPERLARAREPFLLADLVVAAGGRVPLTLRPHDAWRADGDRCWLRKPIRGGGGSGVRPWRPGEPLHPHEIAQEYIEGVPASMVFLANGHRAVVLGLTRQLTGGSAARRATSPQRGSAGRGAYDRAFQPSPLPSERHRKLTGGHAVDIFGASPFIYAGSLYPLCSPAGEPRVDPAADASPEDRAAAVATAVTAALGLRGINGLDFVLRDGELFVLELNPRYPASAELIERATGLSIFEAHADACLGHIRVTSTALRAPSRPPLETRLAALNAPQPATRESQLPSHKPHVTDVWGKAILYARRDVVAGDTYSWLDDDALRDIPFPGERIPRRSPVCTVFARGATHAECHARLATAARIVETKLSGS